MSFTVGIDIGGTFTDTVVMDESGAITACKSPTTPGALLESDEDHHRRTPANLTG